jgi:2-dehydro-3-deoxygluconokinase
MMDVLTFGETMLRFSPPHGQRLESAQSYQVWAAGSESNTAAAITAMGLSATWISRLPDNPMGRKIEAALSARHVDIKGIVWTSSDLRVGTFYAEQSELPRQATVYYDRVNSAAANLVPGDLPDQLFERHRHLHITGITPALSESCAETVTDAILRAKSKGLTISLDVNFRARLWTAEAAAAMLRRHIPNVDILICSSGDASRLFGASGDDSSKAVSLRAQFNIDLAVITCGASGAVASGAGGTVTAAAIPVDSNVDRFGSGDAFAGAFLAEYLTNADIPRSLQYGVTAAAIKRTIAGDLLIASRADIDAALSLGQNTPWR